MVPALRAARQIVRAFSSAILWPLVGQRLADRGQLHRHLGHPGQPARGQLLQHVEVGRHRRVGLLGVEGVLAEEVEGRPDPLSASTRGRVDHGLGRLAGDVAAHDPGRDRHRADQLLDPLAAREHQERSAQQGHADRLRRPPPASGCSRPPASAHSGAGPGGPKAVGYLQPGRSGQRSCCAPGEQSGRHATPARVTFAKKRWRRCCVDPYTLMQNRTADGPDGPETVGYHSNGQVAGSSPAASLLVRSSSGRAGLPAVTHTPVHLPSDARRVAGRSGSVTSPFQGDPRRRVSPAKPGPVRSAQHARHRRVRRLRRHDRDWKTMDVLRSLQHAPHPADRAEPIRRQLQQRRRRLRLHARRRGPAAPLPRARRRRRHLLRRAARPRRATTPRSWPGWRETDPQTLVVDHRRGLDSGRCAEAEPGAVRAGRTPRRTRSRRSSRWPHCRRWRAPARTCSCSPAYVEQFRGWGRGLRRAVGVLVHRRGRRATLAYQVVKYRQREGWSHRDLLRLAHPRHRRVPS